MTERRNNVQTFTCDRCKNVITTLGNGSENANPYTVKHRNFVKLAAHDGAVIYTYDLCDFCLTALNHFIINADESTGGTDNCKNFVKRIEKLGDDTESAVVSEICGGIEHTREVGYNVFDT